MKFNFFTPTEIMQNGDREAFAHGDHWTLCNLADESYFTGATEAEAMAWVLNGCWP